ncbi:MAG: hypothetical protein D6707_10085, partial [Bacteroidetes bacterium]
IYIGWKTHVDINKQPVFKFLLDPGRTLRKFFSFSITPDNVLKRIGSATKMLRPSAGSATLHTQKTYMFKHKALKCQKGFMDIYKKRWWIEKKIKTVVWRPGQNIKYATRKKGNLWTGEYQIPLKVLCDNSKRSESASNPLNSYVWGANFVLITKSNKHEKVYQWISAKEDEYNNPNNFGVISFDDKDSNYVYFDFSEPVSKEIHGKNKNGKIVLTGYLRGKWTNKYRVKEKYGYGYLFKANQKRYIFLKPVVSLHNFSVSFRFKPTSSEKGTMIQSTSSAPYWHIAMQAFPPRVPDRKISVAFRAGSQTGVVLSRTTIKKGKWYTIKITVSRGRFIKLYVN